MAPTMQMFQEGPQFSDRIRSVSIDGAMFFSVLDIFKNYSDSKNVARSWKATETFLIKQGAIKAGWEKGGDTQNVSLRMHRFDGQGQRDTPIGTFKMIMRIGQVTTFKEWEPMRDWMAGLAEERVEEAANPELGMDRAQERFIQAKMRQGMTRDEAAFFLQQAQAGRITHHEWTDALKEFVIDAINYGYATNTEYRGLFGKTAKEIREITGFKTARDGMTVEGRSILTALESTVEHVIRQRGMIKFAEALKIITDACLIYRSSVEGAQRMLGVDLATGQSLLGGGR
jgi:hypothetical protein